MCGLDYLIAQRYGKGRAANESQTKPPNLDKKTELQNRQRAARPFDRLVGLID